MKTWYQIKEPSRFLTLSIFFRKSYQENNNNQCLNKHHISNSPKRQMCLEKHIIVSVCLKYAKKNYRTVTYIKHLTPFFRNAFYKIKYNWLLWTCKLWSSSEIGVEVLHLLCNARKYLTRENRGKLSIVK